MGRKRKWPVDWEEQCREAYEDYGHAVGRMLMWNHITEGELWALIGGTGVWPRWYLKAFVRLYRRENPREAWSYYNKRRTAKKVRDRGDRLKETRESVFTELLTKTTDSATDRQPPDGAR